MVMYNKLFAMIKERRSSGMMYDASVCISFTNKLKRLELFNPAASDLLNVTIHVKP